MQKNISALYREFCKVKKMGWIKSLRKGPTGIGYTFETLINKFEENLPTPDFNGIEIKTIHVFSKRKIHLFNATPDGDLLYPINRLVDNMGYPDKLFPCCRILNISVNTKETTKIGYYKELILKVDYFNQKVFLDGTKNGKKIDLNVSWSFDLLEERIRLKMQYLCVIEACSKHINGSEYYYYNRIHFYKIRGFNTFLKLLDKGIISITFKVGVFKSGNRVGKMHDRGTDFSLEYKNICLLYKEI